MAPTYTWEITKPDGTKLSGSGAAADVFADLPGIYGVTYEASADRACPPIPVSVSSGVNVNPSVTMSANPSSIPAKTDWPAMPDYSFSLISVTPHPPTCEVTLAIVALESDQGYVPPNEGELVQLSPNVWKYTALEEPQTEKCAKPVTVTIAAFMGTMEMAQINVLVFPVHDWWTLNSHQHGPGGQTHPTDVDDFTNAYHYLRWKYATVLATTGGTFSGPPTISPNACVKCPPLVGPCVAACTTCIPVLGCSTTLGTQTFTGSENAAASIIGHELIHTTGGNECVAYAWEFIHDTTTGIFQCDALYHANVVQQVNCTCNGIGCP